MADDPNTSIPPIVVTMIGNGTGDGGAPLTTGTVGTTPDHQPNLVVGRIISPIVAVLIRFANAYLTAIIGALVGGPATGLITAEDLYHLILKCASLALFGPVVALGKDLITILTGLEKKFPLATGSI